MKKIILLLLCFMLLLTGCSSQSTTNGTGNADESAQPSSDEEVNSSSEEETFPELDEIMDKMKEAAKNLPSMLHVDFNTENAKSYFAGLSALDYGIVEDYIYDSTTDTSDPAPEIAIIKLKDKADVDAVTDSLKEHLEGRKRMFENYASQIDERQMPMIESAEVFSKDDLVVLIVAENAKEVKEAFYEAIK